MKILSLILFLLLFEGVIAQHCFFDGHHALVINVKRTGSNKPLPAFYLTELREKYTDSCIYSPGVIKLEFKPDHTVATELATDTNSNFNQYLKSRLNQDYDFITGNQVVFLSMGAMDCMLKDGSNFKYTPRKLIVSYTQKGKLVQVPVAKEQIYHLCFGAGSWKRIKPVEIRL